MSTEKPTLKKASYGFIDKYHCNRRLEILAKYPEIRHLMKGDPSFKYVAAACAITQIVIAYHLRNSSLINIVGFVLLVGCPFACAIANALHELVHDAAFPGEPLWNKAFANFIDWSLGWPRSGVYYRTHRFHHAYLGTNLDAKYPSVQEAAKYDNDIWGRLKFIFCAPLGHAERWTTYVGDEATPFSRWNFRTTWLFNICFIIFVGWRSYLYMLTSMYINDCIYIQGSKSLADHVVDNEKAYARSYYGWLNLINHNIGYHREHHDFPNIPGRYLPEVTRIAKDYYSDPVNIVDSVFGAVWDILRAPPGEGLYKHANKLDIAKVKQEDNESL